MLYCSQYFVYANSFRLQNESKENSFITPFHREEIEFNEKKETCLSGRVPDSTLNGYSMLPPFNKKTVRK